MNSGDSYPKFDCGVEIDSRLQGYSRRRPMNILFANCLRGSRKSNNISQLTQQRLLMFFRNVEHNNVFTNQLHDQWRISVEEGGSGQTTTT